MFRVISANLNGIRSAVRKGFLPWAEQQQADFICLQELKAQEGDLSDEMWGFGKHRGYFHYADKKGYSGVGIYTPHEPKDIIEGLGVPEIDAEGRYLELVYDKLAIISVYLPSGSSGDHRQEAKYRFMDHFFDHLVELRRRECPVIICGDWNIAHHEIDIKNWKGNLKNSGFLPEERAWLSRVLDELEWVDVYRSLYPEASGEAYTWWSNRGRARENNVGWRIDYQIATPDIAQTAHRASIFKEQWFSDHAPLTVDYEWPIQTEIQ